MSPPTDSHLAPESLTCDCRMCVLHDCVSWLRVSWLCGCALSWCSNGQLVGDNLAARVVQYRKHKKPNHFNYWLTGLQKTLSK